MDRRGFLGVMLAACAAPAVVRASSLMRVAAPKIWVPQGVIGNLDRFTVYQSKPVGDLYFWQEHEGAVRQFRQRRLFDDRVIAEMVDPPFVNRRLEPFDVSVPPDFVGEFDDRVKLVPWKVWSHPELVGALK
jgi:hypothetical protein